MACSGWTLLYSITLRHVDLLRNSMETTCKSNFRYLQRKTDSRSTNGSTVSQYLLLILARKQHLCISISAFLWKKKGGGGCAHSMTRRKDENSPCICNKPTTITTHNTVLLQKLTGSQLVKKFPALYGTWRFITASTRTCHLSVY